MSSRKLREHFPEAGPETKLVILGPSQKLRVGKSPLQLIEYKTDKEETMWVAYSKELDTIFMRLVDGVFFT